MKNLFKAAFNNSKYYGWFVCSLITLVGVCIADQLELITLGIIVDKGPDFFSLFGKTELVSKEAYDHLWNTLDPNQSGFISKQDVQTFVQQDNNMHFLQKVFHKIAQTFDLETYKVQKIVLLLLSVALFKGFLLFYSRYITKVLGIKISRDIRQQYFNHIQKLSMRFYQKYNIGSLSTRIVGDADQIAFAIHSCITKYVQMPFIALSSFSMCLYLSWKLSCIIFLVVPMIVIPVLILTRKVKKGTISLQKNRDGFASVLIDFLQGIETIKIFCMEKFTHKKYVEKNDEIEKIDSKITRYDMLMRPILHGVTTVCFVSILLTGLYIWKIPLAELLIFCGFLHLFYEPLRKFADENANIQKGIVAADRLYEVLNIQPEIVDIPSAKKIQDFHEEIVFDDVWFRYEDTWVIKGLSFSIKKSETVAIVGSTGSGKSTILHLLSRLYDPQKGKILIDGVSLTEVTQKSLRSILSYVPQRPFLLQDSVFSNISYGKKLEMGDVIEAAKKAHAHEFIAKLPDKYMSQIAEMGKNLSGGQQQRLAIARALAKKSPLLLLDEATSSLDSLSEKNIKKAIKDLQGQVTQIIVAHRLSTIEHADRIIYVENGKKIAEGTQQELYKQNASFRSMWESSTILQQNV